MPIAVVTGATGFVGAEVVRQLLEKSYTVRATVRSIASHRNKGLVHLAERSEGRLQLFEADLLVPHSFDKAIAGSDYVFHVASPFQFPEGDALTAVVKPALDGTRNVLESAAASKDTIKRVVVTSSCAALHDMKRIDKPSVGTKYTEADWNTSSTPEAESYFYSKVAAERLAFELAKEHGVELVTILPEFVMGPPAAASVAAGSVSIDFFKSVLEGADKVPSGKWTFCDVRDVAEAHVRAAEAPAASGRYIVSVPETLSAKDVTDLLHEHFPQYKIADGEAAEPEQVNDASRVQAELGLRIRPIRDTLRDMADALVKLGIATPVAK